VVVGVVDVVGVEVGEVDVVGVDVGVVHTHARLNRPDPFSIWTEFTVPTGTVRGVNSRDECHYSHACKSFQRAGDGNNAKWLPRV
jgi:hypothetical protein